MQSVLYISAFPPNQRTAGQNYSKNLLNEWSTISEIDLVVFNYKDHPLEAGNSVRILKRISESRFSKLINSLKLPWVHPFFTCRFHFRLLNYLKKIAGQYDIIYFDFSQVFIYSYFIQHPRKIFMAHDVIIQKYERENNLLSRFSLKLLKRTEEKVLKTAHEIYCFSSKDQLLIKEKYHLPSSVVSFYINSEIRNLELESIRVSDYFVLFGAWNRPENEKGLNFFIQNVYPKLTDKKIRIIGPGLSDYSKELIRKHNNIQYLGFLENPYPLICQAQALIAPIFTGAGVKVKVIESLASGTPVIGTDVAMEGIPTKNLGKYILIANNEQEFLNTLQNYQQITHADKIAIRNNFMESYHQNKFLQYI